MGKINLVSDIRLEKIKLKRRKFVVTVSAVLILGVMLVFVLLLQGYKWSRVYVLDSTKKKIAATDGELAKYKDIEDMVVNIEHGLQAVKNIESSEPKWSKFLPILEQVTPNDIRFTEFTQTGNTFTAQAQGRSVQSIARVIKSLENYEYKENIDAKVGKKLFKNVNVDGYDLKGKEVNFSISFEMEQGVLW